jgi:hypothetical protein
MTPDEEYDDDEYDDDADETDEDVDEDEDEGDEDAIDEGVDEDEDDDDADETDEDEDEGDEDAIDEGVDEDEDDDDADESDEDFDEEEDDDELGGDNGRVDFEENKVFVIMRFGGHDSREVFSAIKDECSRLGLNAEIASDMAGSGLVIQDIRDAIAQAEFIICDLTGERQNVYYELGHAHGLGNDALRILLIAKEQTTLHFDIAGFRARFYKSTEDLRGILRTELDRMMRLTR